MRGRPKHTFVVFGFTLSYTWAKWRPHKHYTDEDPQNNLLLEDRWDPHVKVSMLAVDGSTNGRPVALYLTPDEAENHIRMIQSQLDDIKVESYERFGYDRSRA
jgi:hypothetical protein